MNLLEECANLQHLDHILAVVACHSVCANGQSDPSLLKRSERTHSGCEDHVGGGIVNNRCISFCDQTHFSCREPYPMPGHTVGTKNANVIGMLDVAFSPSELRSGLLLAHFGEMGVNSLSHRPGELTRSLQEYVGLAENRT